MKKFWPVIKENIPAVMAVTLIAFVSSLITFLIPISVTYLGESEYNIRTIFILFAIIIASLVIGFGLTIIKQYFTKRF